MADYIEFRRKRWYAALDLPKDVQDQLGRRFFRFTKTDSRSAAAGIAAVWVAGWKQDIQRARKANGGILGPIEREATAWKSALENAKTDEERDSLHEGLLDKLDGLLARSAKGNHDARWNDLPGQKDAQKFHGIATGKRVKFAEHLDEYLATPTTKLTEKVANQIRTDVLRCQSEECSLISDVMRRAIQQWIDKLLVTEVSQGGTTKPTTVRLEGRDYHSSDPDVLNLTRDEYAQGGLQECGCRIGPELHSAPRYRTEHPWCSTAARREHCYWHQWKFRRRKLRR